VTKTQPDIKDGHPIFLWIHNVILNEFIDFLYSYLGKKKKVDQFLWNFLENFYERPSKNHMGKEMQLNEKLGTPE
jgi:hypothetical protein